jgi:hypothetical protein
VSRYCVELPCAAAAGRREVLVRLPNALKGLPDLERGLMRILHRTSHPAELAGTLQVHCAPAGCNTSTVSQARPLQIWQR